MERHNVEYLGYYMATRLLVQLLNDMPSYKAMWDAAETWQWYRYKEAEQVLNKCIFAQTQKKRMLRALITSK